MDVFREDGHLTEQVLVILSQNGSLDETARLEIAEHLAFCDRCLDRYTALLAGTELLMPEHSCQKSLWRRIRSRAVSMLTSRCATAVAAVGLALTVVWGGGDVLPLSARTEELPRERQYVVSEGLHQLGEGLDGAMQGLNDLLILDGFRETRQGGNHS